MKDSSATRKRGRTDWARLRTLSESDIERQSAEEEAELDREFGPARSEDAYGPIRIVVPNSNVRAMRERTGLSQDDFAARFGLSLRTLQQWEQLRRVPDGPARLLLRLIELEPEVVARVAHTEDSSKSTSRA